MARQTNNRSLTVDTSGVLGYVLAIILGATLLTSVIVMTAVQPTDVDSHSGESEISSTTDAISSGLDETNSIHIDGETVSGSESSIDWADLNDVGQQNIGSLLVAIESQQNVQGDITQVAPTDVGVQDGVYLKQENGETIAVDTVTGFERQISDTDPGAGWEKNRVTDTETEYFESDPGGEWTQTGESEDIYEEVRETEGWQASEPTGEDWSTYDSQWVYETVRETTRYRSSSPGSDWSTYRSRTTTTTETVECGYTSDPERDCSHYSNDYDWSIIGHDTYKQRFGDLRSLYSAGFSYVDTDYSTSYENHRWTTDSTAGDTVLDTRDGGTEYCYDRFTGSGNGDGVSGCSGSGWSWESTSSSSSYTWKDSRSIYNDGTYTGNTRCAEELPWPIGCVDMEYQYEFTDYTVVYTRSETEFRVADEVVNRTYIGEIDMYLYEGEREVVDEREYRYERYVDERDYEEYMWERYVDEYSHTEHEYERESEWEWVKSDSEEIETDNHQYLNPNVTLDREDWTMASGVSEVRDSEFTFTRAGMHHGEAGSFTLQADNGSEWEMSVYLDEDTPEDMIVDVNGETVTTTADEVTIDLATGEVVDAYGDTSNVMSLNDVNNTYDLRVENGAEARGTYTLVANSDTDATLLQYDVTTLDDVATVGEQIVYAAEFDVTFESSDTTLTERVYLEPGF